MAKFKYVGPEMLVGRFGRLKTGDVVDLWQTEAEFVTSRNLQDWEAVDVEDLTGVGSILPTRTLGYDLTRIDWVMECKSSLKRMSRSELGEVAMSMRRLGCILPAESETRTYSREHLFEVVYGEAKRLKWDQPDYVVEKAPMRVLRRDSTTAASVEPEAATAEVPEDSGEYTEPEESAPEEPAVIVSADEPDESMAVEPTEKPKKAEKPAVKKDEAKGYRQLRREGRK